MTRLERRSVRDIETSNSTLNSTCSTLSSPLHSSTLNSSLHDSRLPIGGLLRDSSFNDLDQPSQSFRISDHSGPPSYPGLRPLTSDLRSPTSDTGGEGRLTEDNLLRHNTADQRRSGRREEVVSGSRRRDGYSGVLRRVDSEAELVEAAESIYFESGRAN